MPEVLEVSQPAGAGVGFARSLAKLPLNGRQMTLVRCLLGAWHFEIFYILKKINLLNPIFNWKSKYQVT